MHIAYACAEYPPATSANGVSTYTAVMAAEMARRGHAVTVFCGKSVAERDNGEGERNGRVTVRRVAPRGFRVPLLRVVYYRLGGRLFPSHVHSVDSGRGLREAVARAHHEKPIDVLECPEIRGIPNWIDSLGIPIVVRLHAPCAVTWKINGNTPTRLFRSIVKAERRCLQNARIVSAPSLAVVEESQRAFGIRLHAVRIIPNPARLSEVNVADTIGSDSRQILFVGAVDVLKGFDLVVRAFSILADRPNYEDIRLKVVGADYGLLFNGQPPISGPEFIDRVVKNPATASRIELAGRLPYDQVQALRRPEGITVVASRFENFANTIIEAMASGSALVVSDAGGSPEIVQHERNGLLFRSEDWQDLARQVMRLLDDPELRTRLGARARSDVRERYSPEVVGAQMSDFYHEVIDRSQRIAPRRIRVKMRALSFMARR